MVPFLITLSIIMLVCVGAIRTFFHSDVRITTPTSLARDFAQKYNLPRALVTSASGSSSFILALALIVIWGYHRVFATLNNSDPVFAWTFNVIFGIVAAYFILAATERHYTIDGWVSPKVAVLVPLYNEDHHTASTMLNALLNQSQKPDEIHVVDDGSDDPYLNIRENFLANAKAAGVLATWVRTENHGKRHAQVTAFHNIHKAKVFVTVDSDSVLDFQAIKQICLPFRDSRVMSVAGVVLAWNNRVNWFARVTDMLFVTQQLIDRAAMSRLGSVLVNSGGLAAYRVEILGNNANLQQYLSERYLGARVQFSDDSLLTLFALKMGRTVHQRTAFTFTVMPETLGYHYRQQIRWMRGSFIRGIWRLRFLPILSWGFIRQLLGWLQLLVATYILAYFLLWRPIVESTAPPLEALIVPIVISYVYATRYLTVWRSDMNRREQWLVFLCAPFIAIWQLIFLRPLRFWGAITARHTQWGTREEVEIDMEGREPQALPSSQTPI